MDVVLVARGILVGNGVGLSQWRDKVFSRRTVVPVEVGVHGGGGARMR